MAAMRVAPRNACLKIAIVEDHGDLRDLFVDFLEQMGHDVAGYGCADDLDDYLADGSVDLLILDLNLPGEDGYSIAQRLRTAHREMHILMLTARNAVSDRIMGYVSGADNYLTKPVSPQELAIVVDGIMRRVSATRLQAEQVTLDTAHMQLSGPNGTSTLTPPDVILLKNLAEAPARKLAYWRLQELLQIAPDDNGKAALEVRISRLKKKMHDAGVPDPAIKSLWKEGYQLCVPVQIVH